MACGYRFGMPESAFRAAIESHRVDNPVFRAGMYVPTREEVVTLAAGYLEYILDLWMRKSPTELIPDRAQIAEVRRVLADRPDAQSLEIAALVAECDEYIHD